MTPSIWPTQGVGQTDGPPADTGPLVLVLLIAILVIPSVNAAVGAGTPADQHANCDPRRASGAHGEGHAQGQKKEAEGLSTC